MRNTWITVRLVLLVLLAGFGCLVALHSIELDVWLLNRLVNPSPTAIQAVVWSWFVCKLVAAFAVALYCLRPLGSVMWRFAQEAFADLVTADWLALVIDALYLVLVLWVVFLAYLGIEDLELNSWFVSILHLPAYLKHPASAVIAMVSMVPTFVLLGGFLLGDVRFYKYLVPLAAMIHVLSNPRQCWRLALFLCIMQIRNKSRFRIRMSIPSYMEIHTASAMLVKSGWVSVYWADPEVWQLLSPFASRYVEEVGKVTTGPSLPRRRYIISRKEFVDAALNVPNSVFQHASMTAEEAFVVYEDGEGFALTQQVRDLAAFGNLVVISIPPDKRADFQRQIAGVRSADAAERADAVRKGHVHAEVMLNIDYPHGKVAEMAMVENVTQELDGLPHGRTIFRLVRDADGALQLSDF